MPTNINGFTVFGAIEEKWLSFGGAAGALGVPTSNETATYDGNGRFQNFTGGIVSWHPSVGPHVVWGLIGERWLQLGREQFGYPITDETAAPDGLGRYNHFRAIRPDGSTIGESTIYWKAGTGAHEVYGNIRDKWASLEWERGPLGYPTGPEHAVFDGIGRRQEFEGGMVAWRSETGAFVVWGLIGQRWLDIGAEQFGYPVTDEMTAPDGVGRFNHFRAFNAAGAITGDSSIYWRPETGPHEIYGAIRDSWAALGWETSALGYPLDHEQPAFDGIGRRQGFQGGVMSWRPETGAHVVWGLIGNRWNEIGSERFGYPICDELPTPDGRGRFNHFRQFNPDGSIVGDASIYWSPETGPHEVYGAIRERWGRRGWETSNLGYPVDAEHDRTDGPGREQRFEHGRIVWSAEHGALFDPLVFTAPIVTGGMAALGGALSVTIHLDGSTQWQGHAHDSGADGYDFGISAVIPSPTGRGIAFAHTGSVGGTFTAGSRNDDWSETSPPSPWISSHLAEFNDSVLKTHLEYNSDIGGTLEELAGLLLRWTVGSVVTEGTGTIIFIGLSVGSLISTGSLVPGARLAEGILWMAGPGNTLLAITAEGIAKIGSRTRELSDDEYQWANAEVFRGALPPRDRLVLTDTIGGENRAFTFPRFDGKITLNMGSESFDNPRNWPNSAYGRVFVHELVHACQIQHTTIDLVLLADALASKLCEATGGDPYEYGLAGPAYSDFNLEQQAQIVSDWFAGAVGSGSNQTGIPKDEGSPYFRYVNDVRIGNI
jgi:uncharacterized protein with LGFP repeats